MLPATKILVFLKPSVVVRYRKKVGTPDEGGCLPWLGAKRRDGYGLMKIRLCGVTKAHRIAWTLANQRDIPQDHVIDHVCGNKSCVNPAHLEAVKQSVNVARYHAKRPKPITCPKGHVREIGLPCKQCNRENQAKWKAANPQKAKEIYRRYEIKRAKTRWDWHKAIVPTIDPDIVS